MMHHDRLGSLVTCRKAAAGTNINIGFINLMIPGFPSNRSTFCRVLPVGLLGEQRRYIEPERIYFIYIHFELVVQWYQYHLYVVAVG